MTNPFPNILPRSKSTQDIYPKGLIELKITPQGLRNEF